MYRGSKKHLAYMTEWNKEHLTAFTIRLNNEADSDVIAKLKSVPNRAEYLRQIVRADINAKCP